MPPPLFWKDVDYEPEVDEQNFCCTFETASDKKVLSRITLAVRHNEILTLLGPSRAGKSSALALAVGYIEPLEGFVCCTLVLCTVP